MQNPIQTPSVPSAAIDGERNAHTGALFIVTTTEGARWAPPPRNR